MNIFEIDAFSVYEPYVLSRSFFVITINVNGVGEIGEEVTDERVTNAIFDFSPENEIPYVVKENQLVSIGENCSRTSSFEGVVDEILNASDLWMFILRKNQAKKKVQKLSKKNKNIFIPKA